MIDSDPVVLVLRLFNSAELDRIHAVAGVFGFALIPFGSGLLLVKGLYRDTADANAFFALAEVDY